MKSVIYQAIPRLWRCLLLSPVRWPSGLLFLATVLIVFARTAAAQYPGWQHSGSLYILTTPEGANSPASEYTPIIETKEQ